MGQTGSVVQAKRIANVKARGKKISLEYMSDR